MATFLLPFLSPTAALCQADICCTAIPKIGFPIVVFPRCIPALLLKASKKLCVKSDMTFVNCKSEKERKIIDNGEIFLQC